MKTIRLRQVRHYWRIYALVLPAIAIVLTFSYFPAVSATYHAFFRWNGDDLSQFVRLANFRRALSDPMLARSFGFVMILIAANLVKMVPTIVTAVVIHRLVSARARYLYRVAFVIPMIIPAMVWLLIWKYFYDPNVGVLNGILTRTGLIRALQWLDRAMPALSHAIAPIRQATVDPVFGSVWGLALAGVLVLAMAGGLRRLLRSWMLLALLLPASLYVFGPIRMPVMVAALAGVSELLRRRGMTGRDLIRWIGGAMIAAAVLLVLLSMTWTEPTKAFATGRPAWLGHEKLIRAAYIFWGFPWVGIVGVLLYLSGLGNIDQSVYEAADMDGAGWFRKFWSIELPLIMTQVRLNLVLMIIGTLKGWGMVYVLFGDSGGPGGSAMLPGLYMFRKAFTDGEAGYACGIGLLLFGLIVVLTLINNRYVRVSK